MEPDTPQNPMSLARNANYIWGHIIVELACRMGCRRFVISPGSRSAPLAVAASMHSDVSETVILDERSAAFFALGMAKQTGETVALICTSGSAASHYMPAVIEAFESAIPLLVLSADRPPYMRHCHSGQTIDQCKLFGGFVQHYAELPMPSMQAESLFGMREMVAYALRKSHSPCAGPVHLNVPFSDLLVPDECVSDIDSWAELSDIFFKQIVPPAVTKSHASINSVAWPARGLIVVGDAQTPVSESFVEAIAALSEQLAWPVLDAGFTPIRSNAEQFRYLISEYEFLLAKENFASTHRAEVVLLFGGWPTSKRLRAWVRSTSPQVIACDTQHRNLDGLNSRAQHLPLSPEGVLEQVCVEHSDQAWAKEWLVQALPIRTELPKYLKQKEHFQASLFACLSAHMPERSSLFVGSSMPIRYHEWCFGPSNKNVQVYVNRGANGIDGAWSTALGIAASSEQAVFAVVGDLTALHDCGGMRLAQKLPSASLTFIIVNNAGGGIFQHLPIAAYDPPFEACFTAAEKVDFKALASAHSIEYHCIEAVSALRPYLEDPVAAGVRLIELRCDRKQEEKDLSDLVLHLSQIQSS